jgi:3-deoxy-D-manno-octulosonic-acid transferase
MKAPSGEIIGLLRVKIQSFKQYEFFILFLNQLFKPISGIYTMNVAKAQRFWRTLKLKD